MRTFVAVQFNANNKLDLSNFQADPTTWFAKQGAMGNQTWLLAFAEDGVIWGKLTNDKLVLSSSTPPLVAPTLLEARLFGEAGEVHLWRTDTGFSACHVTDTAREGVTGAADEWLRLWGVEAEGTTNGFTQLVDGQEGLRHAVPLMVPKDAFTRSHPRYHPTILKIRHYFQVDQDTGVTSIALSRLVSVKSESLDEYRKRVNNYE